MHRPARNLHKHMVAAGMAATLFTMSGCNSSSDDPAAPGIQVLSYAAGNGMLARAEQRWGASRPYSETALNDEPAVLIVNLDGYQPVALSDPFHPVRRALTAGVPTLLENVDPEHLKALGDHAPGLIPEDYSAAVLLHPRASHYVRAPRFSQITGYSSHDESGTIETDLTPEATSVVASQRWEIGAHTRDRVLDEVEKALFSAEDAQSPLSCSPAGSKACEMAQGRSQHDLKTVTVDYDFEGKGHCLNTTEKDWWTGIYDGAGGLKNSWNEHGQCPVVQANVDVAVYRNWPLDANPNRQIRTDITHLTYPMSRPAGDNRPKVTQLDHHGAFWYQVAFDSSHQYIQAIMRDNHTQRADLDARTLRMLNWQPKTEDQSTNYEHTFGWHLDVSGDLKKEGAEGGISGGVSFSRSVSYSIPDWQLQDYSQDTYQSSRFEQLNPYAAYKPGTPLKDYKWWCVGEGVIAWAGIACHAWSKHIKSENLGGGSRGSHLSSSTLSFENASVVNVDERLNDYYYLKIDLKFMQRWDAVGCYYEKDTINEDDKRIWQACGHYTSFDNATWRNAMEKHWNDSYFVRAGALVIDD